MACFVAIYHTKENKYEVVWALHVAHEPWTLQCVYHMKTVQIMIIIIVVVSTLHTYSVSLPRHLFYVSLSFLCVKSFNSTQKISECCQKNGVHTMGRVRIEWLREIDSSNFLHTKSVGCSFSHLYLWECQVGEKFLFVSVWHRCSRLSNSQEISVRLKKLVLSLWL